MNENSEILKEECSVCEGDIFYSEEDKKWYLRVEESGWNDYLDAFNYQDVEINYCYNCGKDYRNKPTGTMKQIKEIIRKRMKEQNLTFEELKRMVENDER